MAEFERSIMADLKPSVMADLNRSVMADLIGHLTDYQMPGHSRA